MNLATGLAAGAAMREMRESIAGEIAATLQSIQRSRTGRIEDRDLAWLALVPVWTVPLARAAGFPGEDTALDTFLDHAGGLGLLAQDQPAEFVSRRVQAALHRSSDHQFWMPETERARALAGLRERLGVQALWHEMGVILRRMPAVDSPPALVQWRELAGRTLQGDDGQAAGYLRDVLRRHLERGETAAALGWLRTGTLLAHAFGGEIDSAVMRGRREVEVAYRRSHDRRALVGFLRREEQIQSFKKLIEGPDTLWALHFLGTGGAGKTMLIRHINAELAQQHQCITARVDFDYISPNYPRLQPEQLLVELADELRGHSAPEEFARFEDKVRSLRESMRDRPPDLAAIDPLDTPEFQSVQRAFEDWVRGLGRRVVLILDTCEELAKFQPGGEMAPSIRATYRILEHLHGALPSLRVVFAGRRPLAQSGAGWTLRREGLVESRRHLPETKTYLQLHLLRGFDEREVDDYFRHQGVSPDAELLAVIREKSRESTALIELLGDCPLRTELLAGEPVALPRANPFDLSLYAQWLREKPDLTSTFIREGGTDPYIELRIARRLTDGVRELLPAVTFLRRFDESMLRPATRPVSDSVFAANFRELAEQEWITYQNDDAGVFLEVDRNLHPRLVRYFDHGADQRRLLENARRQLAPGLASQVRYWRSSLLPQAAGAARRETALGFDLIYAALRALEPEASAALWEEIEARIIETGRWDWARTITARLLGEEEAGRVSAELRPALLATQTSVMLHSERGPAVLQAWENVIAVAGDARPAERARKIEDRAWLGKIAASRPDAITPDDIVRLNRLWEQLTGASGEGAYGFEQTAASLFAATETVVDAIEAGKKLGALSVRNPAAFPADSIGPELQAFGLTLCSRLQREQVMASEAVSTARDALTVAHTGSDRPAQRWAGWVAPDSIENFAALEWLLLWRWYDENEGAREAARLWPELPGVPAPRNEDDPAPPRPSPDVERRVSLQLELQLAAYTGEFPMRLPPDLEWWTAADFAGPSPFERAAHRAVAPLVVNLADCLLANGEVDRALALLETRIQQAKELSADSEVLLHCQRAKLKIVSRMRLLRRGEGLLARSLEAHELAAVAWPVRSLIGLPPAQLPMGEDRVPREVVHAWWRSRIGSDEHSRRGVIRLAREIFGREKDDGRIPPSMLFADFAESDWYEIGGTPARWDGDLPRLFEEAIENLRARPTIPVAGIVRVSLRAAALRQATSLPDRKRVGSHRLAELALEEGELLALRIPNLAVRLLEIAYDNFVAANHWNGALISSICAASAARRANLDAMVAHLLRSKVRPAYDKVAERHAGEFPSWEELERLCDGPVSSLSRLDHPLWAGWLHRLFCCLLGKGKSRQKKQQLVWIARHYGEHIPCELGFSEDEKLAARSQQRSPLREDWVFRLAVLSVVFSIIVALTLVTFSRTEEAYTLGGVSTLLFCGAALAALVRVIRAWHAARRRVVMAIDPVQRSALGDVAAMRACRWHILTADTPAGGLPGFPLRAPGLERYAAAAKEVPFEVVDDLLGRRRRLLGNAWWNRLAIPLLVPPLLSSASWEGLSLLALPGPFQPKRNALIRMLGRGTRVILVVGSALVFAVILWMAISEGWTAEVQAVALVWGGIIVGLLALLGSRRCRGEELHFHRAGARTRTDAQRNALWKTKRIEIDCSRKWHLMVGRGLEFFQRRKFRVNLSTSRARDGSASIYHAVGRAVSSTAGFQLQVATEELLSEEAATADSGRALISAEEMRGRDALINILQGEPLTEHPLRSSSDRESAALLRALGGELFAAGAEVVIVLPSLHAPLAQAALLTLSQRLAATGTPRLPGLLDAIAEVRTVIREWPAPPSYGGPSDLEWHRHDQIEASLDVCLFARTDLPPFPPASPAPS